MTRTAPTAWQVPDQLYLSTRGPYPAACALCSAPLSSDPPWLVDQPAAHAWCRTCATRAGHTNLDAEGA